MITAVTAFVPIPGHPRSEAEYHELAEPFMAMTARIPLLSAEGDLGNCWLWRWLMERPDGYTWSVSDNPQKNSIAYHCVQAQKTEWLVAAAEIDPLADVFCWIDYGIFHVRGVTSRIIEEFLVRAEDERTIAIPGCWEKGSFSYDDSRPCWRFCGGVMLVPRAYIVALDQAMKREYIRWFKQTKNISWEVNTLTRVEHLNPDLPFWWYRANHDKTIFTNYKATEHADGQQTQTVRGIESRYC